MNELSQKKLIVYVGVAIILFGAGTLLTYLFIFRGGEGGGGEPPETVSEPVSGFPEAGPGTGRSPGLGEGPIQEGSGVEIPIASGIQTRLFPVTDAPALSIELSRAEDKLYYFKKEGGEIGAFSFPAGTHESLSTITVIGLFNAAWSPTRDRAAVSYLDGDVVKSFLFKSVGTSSVATLPTGIKSIAWSNSGSSLVYATEKDGETLVSTADSSGKNQKIILRTPVRGVRVSWPASERVYLETNPSGTTPGYVFLFTRSTGELRRFLGPLNGLTALWSPGGGRALTGSTDRSGKIASVAVYDAAGKEIAKPDFQTIPEKCVWVGEEKVYCAVPRGIPQDALMPDDYLRGDLNTNDRIVLFNIKTKTASGIFNDGGYDMTTLRVTKDEKYIFFVDRITGRVWGIDVAK